MTLRIVIAAPDREPFLEGAEVVRRLCRARSAESGRLDEIAGPADFFREMDRTIASRDLLVADLSPDRYPFVANPMVEIQVECARRLGKPVLVLDRRGVADGSLRYAELEEALARELDRLESEREVPPAVDLPPRVVNSLGMELALVPAGIFTLGDPDVDDNPPRRVQIGRPFHLGVHPVTNRQYSAFRPEHSSGCYEDYFLTGPDQPAVEVSWHDAVAFCDWLSAAEGARYRLPTEAEWECACRAGRDPREGRYPWGLGWPPPTGAGNYGLTKGLGADRFPVTSPVGRFEANPWGFRDLGGNVWEWCADWYGGIAPGDAADPEGPDDGVRRVLKGAAWSSEEEPDLRTSWRETLGPDETDVDVGFRVVLG